MGCNKCSNNSCRGGCTSSVTSIKIENNSIGRDGESAYELALLEGFEGTLEEFVNQMLENKYNIDNW